VDTVPTGRGLDRPADKGSLPIDLRYLESNVSGLETIEFGKFARFSWAYTLNFH
jgi:hypothetical protein